MKPFSPPTIYHDGASLFLELPGSPGQTFRFPFTEGGLSKALRFVPNIAKQPGYLTGSSNLLKAALPKAKLAKRTAASRIRATFSEAAREAAGAVVRKLKLGD